MTTYRVSSTGHSGTMRPIVAESPGVAAEIAAERVARRHYGRRANIGTRRLDSWSADGSTSRYEAYVGKRTQYGFIGQTVWIHVERI